MKMEHNIHINRVPVGPEIEPNFEFTEEEEAMFKEHKVTSMEKKRNIALGLLFAKMAAEGFAGLGTEAQAATPINDRDMPNIGWNINQTNHDYSLNNITFKTEGADGGNQNDDFAEMLKGLKETSASALDTVPLLTYPQDTLPHVQGYGQLLGDGDFPYYEETTLAKLGVGSGVKFKLTGAEAKNLIDKGSLTKLGPRAYKMAFGTTCDKKGNYWAYDGFKNGKAWLVKIPASMIDRLTFLEDGNGNLYLYTVDGDGACLNLWIPVNVKDKESDGGDDDNSNNNDTETGPEKLKVVDAFEKVATMYQFNNGDFQDTKTEYVYFDKDGHVIPYEGGQHRIVCTRLDPNGVRQIISHEDFNDAAWHDALHFATPPQRNGDSFDGRLEEVKLVKGKDGLYRLKQ